ncbi:MAG: tetratricopeptide repeat protein [Chloroflexi bacterium]|nr:tetratricopeptide repeat protein [Chloroflexota bacterium]MCC6893771.1 tetratricopeptide repeat protein [Anaerolineae bacterium]
MKRIATLLTALLLMLIVSTALAQEATDEPAPPADTAALEAQATEISNSLADAQRAAEDARVYADDARDEASRQLEISNTLLGMFQNVTQTIFAIFGIAGPVLAIAAGYLGFNRLNAAQKELTEAKERFEREIQEKQDQLTKVRQELEASSARQRQETANANLAVSLLTLGERQYRSQDFQGALNTYNRALELDPYNLITHYRAGYVYVQSGNLEKAEYHLNAALRIENDFAPALAALGYVYRRMGEKMQPGIDRDQIQNMAEEHLLKALKISDKLVDDDNESWWGSLGGLYRRRGQIDQAIAAYERASKITPKSSYAFSNLALLYLHKQNKEEMLKTYVRVEQLAFGEVQADVDNYWAYADLLTAQLALGKTEEAKPVLESVLEIAPKDSPYVFESLLDTLRRLETALGEADSAHIAPFIASIEERIAMQQPTNKGE